MISYIGTNIGNEPNALKSGRLPLYDACLFPTRKLCVLP